MQETSPDRSAGSARRPRRSVLARQEERTALWLLTPALVIILLIAIYPLGQVFYLSFTNAEFASSRAADFVGLENYRTLLSFTVRELPPVIDADTGLQEIRPDGTPRFESWVRILPREPLRYTSLTEFGLLGRRYVLGASNADFMRAVWDTVVFTVGAVGFEAILGMIVALTLAAEFRGRGLMRTAMLVPWAVITVVAARIWEWMLQPTRVGLFNTVLSQLGIGDGNIGFFQNPALQLPSMIAMDVWKTTPFMALLFLAGLTAIPSSLYEAAEIDGASRIRSFFWITLPLLAPTIAVALVFRTLDSLRVFDIFQVVLGGQRYSMASFAQTMLIEDRQVGLSSAASVVIFLIILVFAVFYMRILNVETE